MANIHSIQKGYFQIVALYRYPNSPRTDFKNGIRCRLWPVLDLTARLVILGDFNIRIDSINAEFVKFMETLFSCVQQIKQFTTDSRSVLDLIFANCQAFCDVIEAYWTDHKLTYCAIDTKMDRICNFSLLQIFSKFTTPQRFQILLVVS